MTLKIKNIIKDYTGYAHDIYTAWLYKPCKDIQAIKNFLYNYCEINRIDTCMGIDNIKIYNQGMACEFYIIKD